MYISKTRYSHMCKKEDKNNSRFKTNEQMNTFNRSLELKAKKEYRFKFMGKKRTV